MAVYYGTYKNRTDTKDIAVYIRVGEGDTIVPMGGGGDTPIQFGKDPVVISTDMEDTFEIITMKTCEINLLVKNYLGNDLFAGNSRSIIVNVYEGNDCIFAGFLEPQVFSQPWDHEWVSLTLRATDALATLQYYQYMNLTDETSYSLYKSECDSVTALSILTDMLKAFPNLDIRNGSASTVYYDGSIRLSASATATSIWDKTQLYELLFLGEEFDDVWSEDEVIEELLKYFNLHIRQEGLDFYIYHWASVRAGLPISWTPLLVGQSGYRISPNNVVTDSSGNIREQLVSVDNQTITIPGNILPKVLDETIEYVNGEYRRYYYYVKPNGDKIKTTLYEVVDRADNLTYIHNASIGGYKVLVQSAYGDYNYNSLEAAPSSAYSGGTFAKPYYQAINN